MSTTYTISNDTYDGTYGPITGLFTTNLSTALGSPVAWAISHFGGLTWDHTLLTAATFSVVPITFTGGVYEVDVILVGDGVPTAALLAAATRIPVGTLTVTGDDNGTSYLDLNTKVASTVTQAGGTFAWVPNGAFTLTGTANSAGFGNVNAAWTKHERNPSDNTLFLGRSVTFVIRQVSGSGIVFSDVAAGFPSKLTVDTISSNTGLTGTRYIRDWDRGRASGVIECPKTSWDIPADEAVRDGFTGMLVAPEAYDRPEAKARSARPSNPSPRRRA